MGGLLIEYTADIQALLMLMLRRHQMAVALGLPQALLDELAREAGELRAELEAPQDRP